jgi:hypothetical protein
LPFGAGIFIFPGIIALIGRIAAVDWPVRRLKLAFSQASRPNGF